MRKLLLSMLLILACMATAQAESGNAAASFTACPGFYIVGEDFPAGAYEIRCAAGTSLINIEVKDADGKPIASGDFRADRNERLAKIRLSDGFVVQVSDGSAYFAPSTGGIVFDADASADASVDERTYRPLVLPAIDALKAHWKEGYVKDGMSRSGYLEIKNTRIIRIQEGLEASQDTSAASFFGGVDYFVEFVLYTDYYGSEPYYGNAQVDNCVVAYENGAMQVSSDPLNLYRSRSYNMDYSGIIEEIVDLGAEYNAAYRLLDEE